jgi:hypothetical protein
MTTKRMYTVVSTRSFLPLGSFSCLPFLIFREASNQCPSGILRNFGCGRSNEVVLGFSWPFPASAWPVLRGRQTDRVDRAGHVLMD